jgi:hypothetical protein
MSEQNSLGWWCISGQDILVALRRVGDGEDADMVYLEMYANSEHERVIGRGEA